MVTFDDLLSAWMAHQSKNPHVPSWEALSEVLARRRPDLLLRLQREGLDPRHRADRLSQALSYLRGTWHA